MHDIRNTVNKWLADGDPIALATVIYTWGSAPRKTGAKMAVRADMHMVGSVSGGCVEADVVREALKTLEDQQPRLLDYSVSNETALGVGLACGGSISVLVETLDPQWWHQLDPATRQASVVFLDEHQRGHKALLSADGTAYYQTMPISEAIRAAVLETLADGQSTRQVVGEHDLFIDLHLPSPHLIIIGGSHVGMALQKLAQTLDYRVSLVDPRKAFATTDRFPQSVAIYQQYPDKVLPELKLGPDTFIAVLSHDPKIDDPALITALQLPVSYVGLMSSQRTHEQRLERLRAAGLSTELLARIHTPIGINIKAQTPEEIALSIMAEIVAVRNGALL